MHCETPGGYGMRERIRVLIADDSAVFRCAVTRLLRDLAHVEVIGAADDGAQAVALVGTTRPDMVLMDLQMPGVNGLQATRQIRAEFPDVRVVMTTVHDSPMWNAAGIAAGADRFIPKRELIRELPRAIAQLFPGRAGESSEERP